MVECVEAEAKADWLRAEGIDLFQGYFFGRPDTKSAWRHDPDEKAA